MDVLIQLWDITIKGNYNYGSESRRFAFTMIYMGNCCAEWLDTESVQLNLRAQQKHAVNGF